MNSKDQIRQEYDDITHLLGSGNLKTWYYSDNTPEEIAYEAIAETREPFHIIAFTPQKNNAPGHVTVSYHGRTATFDYYSSRQPDPINFASELIIDWFDICNQGTIDEYLNQR